MNDDDQKRVRQEIKEEFQIGRARLFSLKNEKKLRVEIAQDKEQLFALFKSQGLVRQLEFTECLKRLLMNFNKLTSYRGILQGFEMHPAAAELRKDRARYHLCVFLQKHPEAKNEELVAYLDNKNKRLKKLKTSRDDFLWAPPPKSWKRAFDRENIEYIEGQYWGTALNIFPKLSMPYLSKARTMATEARVKNVLFNWPELVKRHKQERK